MSALLLPALAASSSGQGAQYVDDVFSAYLRTGTGADTTVTTGIDMTKGYMLWSKGRSGATEHAVYDSARGATLDLATNSTAAQTTQVTGLKAVSSTGHTIGSLAKMNTSGATYVDWVFRKAPKFFDVVTYTGNGVARTVNHSLGVAPDIIIAKKRSNSSDWFVSIRSQIYSGEGKLQTTEALSSGSYTHINGSAFSQTTFPLSANFGANDINDTYVAYLFATLPGISKVGSYTGNGSSQTIDCGFSTGARFFLVKATSTTGSWWVYDSARGIVSAADPALQLNSTAAEITSADAVDPASVGIIVNQEATCSINATGVSYIFLAIA